MTTVYTKANCPQCYQTKKWLGDNDVPYVEVRIDESVDALEYVKSLGFLQAPVVIDGNRKWSGFDREMLEGCLDYDYEKDVWTD